MCWKKSLFLAVLAVLLFVGLIPDAVAQGNPRVTIYGAGAFVRGERTFVVGGDTFRTQFVDGGRLLARASLDLTSHWTVEADYGFGRSNFRVNELSGTPQQRDFGVRVNDISFNLIRFFTSSDSRFRPYLGAGLGWLRYSPTDAAKASAQTNAFIDEPAAIQASNKFSFPVGGGVELRLNRWLGTRIDVRDHINGIPRFGVPQTSSGTGGDFFPVDGIVHNLDLSGGVVFYLTPRSRH
jgi:opacity protein-like surface antigen